MKDFKNLHKIAGQSNINVQKSQKHEVNLQKNSTIYFQVGLILCLLATYSLFEMKFETSFQNYVALSPIDEIEEINIENFTEYKEEQPIQEPVKVQKLGTKDPIISDEPLTEIKKTILSEPPTTNKIEDVKNISVERVAPDVEPIPFYKIEKAPIYPGCENAKSNDERKQCMSDKITALVSRKFSPDLASELGLTGVQSINVEFKIDKNGMVTDIRARAPHIGLEKEAIRVVKKIPQMQPGMQRNNPVEVLYWLPIKFKVRD